ncbi:hypothetical protein L484_025051 [Morus notabilis]|uniref:Uncharacterized protein n=1 Tax=Morus notabilis TaxID=981085 RepID=W9R713_9ROSA|nr:hypothetical protein L484_025051 [Morus notabilis]
MQLGPAEFLHSVVPYRLQLPHLATCLASQAKGIIFFVRPKESFSSLASVRPRLPVVGNICSSPRQEPPDVTCEIGGSHSNLELRNEIGTPMPPLELRNRIYL